MEMARSDADEARISKLLQTYVDALNATPITQRDSQLNAVIRSLSVTFALGELLGLLPSKVDSLIICCPPSLRLIPWHLLLIESALMSPSSNRKEGMGGKVKGDGQLIEMYLLEKYTVRLGPTLPLWELCFDGISRMKRAKSISPTDNICAINGNDLENNGDLNNSTFLEINCVTNVWLASFSNSEEPPDEEEYENCLILMVGTDILRMIHNDDKSILCMIHNNGNDDDIVYFNRLQ